MNLSAVDLVDLDQYVTTVPHEQFTTLRHEAPVFWHDEPDGKGFWAVTRYDDVVAINRDWETFSSSAAPVFLKDMREEVLPQQRLLMVNMDPPMHTRYRLL